MNSIIEPLLTEDDGREYVLFPIPTERRELWDYYKLQLHLLWTAEELDLTQDRRDWNSHLNPNEKHFLSHVLAFFASADLLVVENLLDNFCAEVKWVEAKAFYGIQNAIEMIHSEVYAKLIDTVITDDKEKERLFHAITTIPAVKQKHAWAMKFMDPETRTFPERLVAFAVFEGLLFSSSFCSIYFFKHERGGKLPGLCTANELISRDEGIHARFAAHLYQHHVKNKLSTAEVHAIVADAVETEREFVMESLPVALLGMNGGLMLQYVKFCANKLLRELGVKELYPDVTNPFTWMHSLSLMGQTNFFERRPTEYQTTTKGLTTVGGLDLENEVF